MEANEAREVVRDVTEDVLCERGDMGLDQVRKWAVAYSHWRAACEALTADEIAAAMDEGMRAYTDSLADACEESRFADDGEAAYGRED